MGTELKPTTSIRAAAGRIFGALRGSNHRRAGINQLMMPGQMMPGQGPTIADESTSLLWTPVTPDRAKAILESAVRGDLHRQEQLFRMMLDSWPRLAKATGEVCRAASRLAYQVQEPEEESPQSGRHAETVRRAINSWRPRPATMEIGFEEALDALVMARHTGLSVLELHWQQTPYGILPRAAWHLAANHLAWNDIGTEIGLRTGDAPWRPFSAHKFLVGAWRSRPGAPVATALLRSLVPYWVGRTYGYQWLLRFAQIFGMPIRWANYDASMPETGAQVATMMQNLGTNSWAAFPAGVDVKLIEATSNARDNPQLILQELADQACDLLILGQTLSGTSQATGLGSGTAELHGGVRREVIAGAAQFVADILNYQLVPSLVEINYGADFDPAALPIVVPDMSSPADPKGEAERIEILARTGLRIPSKWVYETQGIPEPDEEAEVLAPASAPGPRNVPAEGLERGDPTPDPPKGEKSDLPNAAEGSMAAWKSGHDGQSIQSASAAELFEELTGVTRRWIGPVEQPMRRLLALAQAEAVTEEDFAAALEEARAALPELFDDLDTEALAGALRRTMATAMVNGATERAAEEVAPA
jgi:phage gp29-like protein